MLRASLTCALVAASVSADQASFIGYAKEADKTEFTSVNNIAQKRDKDSVQRGSASFYSSALTSITSPKNSPRDFVFLEDGLAQRKPALRGQNGGDADERDIFSSIQNTQRHATHPLLSIKWTRDSPSPERVGIVDGHTSQTRVENLLRRTHRQKNLGSVSPITGKNTRDLNLAGLRRKTEEGTVNYHIDSLRHTEERNFPRVHPGRKMLRKIVSAKLVSDGDSFTGSDIPVPDLRSTHMKLLNVGKEVSRPDEDGERSIVVKKGEAGMRASAASHKFHAPVRRLTPLVPAWRAAKQHVDRRTKKEEETFQAFEMGVAQLKTDTMKELAEVLGTKDRPVDMRLLEKVVKKVGLNGLGEPCPRGLSIKEMGVMTQAKRHRQQVDRVRSRYERGTRYLTEELREWLQLSSAYRHRISDVVNNGMYTSAAQLYV